MTKKNGGNIPPVNDQRTTYIPIGCQNCIECRKKKARDWQIRLLEEVKTNKNGKFITLTFSNASIMKLQEELKGLRGYELDNAIATIAVRRFLENWRSKYKKSIRHWLVTEIGHKGTENIHLHGIMWTNESVNEIKKKWTYGWVWTGENKNGTVTNYVNERTVNYIIKYVSKRDKKHEEYKSIILTSKGIGSKYIGSYNSRLNKYNEEETNETYKTSTGHKITLPIYWRNKIYTEEEREKLWIEKLDKQEIWVMGEKVKIDKGTEQLDKLREYYRKLNIELGYGTDQKKEEKSEYEKNRRNMMIMTRIQKAYAIEEKKSLRGGNSKDIGKAAESAAAKNKDTKNNSKKLN
ncbi:MAG: replication initiator protein [Microvirus sp.]|nr:MAG: replication initiator protein [Microvirus sp.]